jgi:hypothetical protein
MKSLHSFFSIFCAMTLMTKLLSRISDSISQMNGLLQDIVITQCSLYNVTAQFVKII